MYSPVMSYRQTGHLSFTNPALGKSDLEKKPALRFSRDMFLLSFYLRGIPFVDLVHLRKTDVKHNTIYYYRHKTRQQLSVHIESYAAQIIK